MSKKAKYYTVPVSTGEWATELAPSEAELPPIPKKRTAKFKHGDKELEPMTDAEANSLDQSDEIKYIGKMGTEPYRTYGRRVVRLSSKPKVNTTKGTITIGGSTYYSGVTLRIKDTALIGRGDPHSYDFNRATRYVPAALARMKINLAALVKNARHSTDFWIEQLPLHKKLELFKKFTPEEQQLYDFIYKDVEEVLHPKDEEQTNEPTTE